MEFNVSTKMGFENQNYLRNQARNILAKNCLKNHEGEKIIDLTSNLYSNSQLNVLKASTQISVNNTLSETLKYLRTHANKNVKKVHVLGELWSIISTQNENSDNNPYKGELFDFQIDKNAKNIFAA